MKYYIIAGEASGDLHGSNLIKELKKLDKNAHFRCWGGDLMNIETNNLAKHHKDYSNSVKAMKKLVDDPDETPSAKMLSQIREKDYEFSEFALEIAKGHRKYFMANNKSNEEKLNFYNSEAIASIQRQKDIESSDILSLDNYLLKY